MSLGLAQYDQYCVYAALPCIGVHPKPHPLRACSQLSAHLDFVLEEQFANICSKNMVQPCSR